MPETYGLPPDPTLEILRPEYPSVPHLFEESLKRSPDAIAISDPLRQWTYGEVGRLVADLRQTLERCGVGPGDVVGLHGCRGFGMFTGMLAVLSSGGVILPVDSGLPEKRQELLLNEGSPRIVIEVVSGQSSECRQTIESKRAYGKPVQFNETILRLDSETAAITEFTSHRTRHGVGELESTRIQHSADAAYIFFTSGSTGKPKGILGSHQGLSHFLTWQRSEFGIGPGDRVAQLTALSFDVVLRDIFLPLTSGGTLCLPGSTETADGSRLFPWLQREKITVLHAVPSLARHWLAQLETTSRVHLKDLRYVFFAGEPLTQDLIVQWRKLVSDSCTVINLYGPTETTLAKCYYRVPDNLEPGIQPIGHPLPQVQALILNESNQQCAANERGEIVLRTPFRSLGYLGSHEQNGLGERRGFQPNPFREDPADQVYFTGDRGYYRTDGNLEIIGRLDDQIKIHGIRIEPAEIAFLLSEHPLVGHCVVLPSLRTANEPVLFACLDQQTEWQEHPNFGDPRGILGGDSGKSRNGELPSHRWELPQKSHSFAPGHVAIFVVPKKPFKLTRSELRSWLAERFPVTAASLSFIFLDRIPLTPNGKVDRQALLEQSAAEGRVESCFKAPRTELESKLAEIWQQVLGRGVIGIADHFLDSGGHSLRAASICALVAKNLNYTVPLRWIFENPTIEQLSAKIETAVSELMPGFSIKRASRTERLRASHSQRGFWIMHQLLAESATYNQPFAWRFRGQPDWTRLRQALTHILSRHEILRTAFHEHESEILQQLYAANGIAVRWREVSLRNVVRNQRDAALKDLVKHEVRRPFDLTAAPLWRVLAIDLADDDQMLVITFHHSMIDEWSLQLLAREIAAFCLDGPAGTLQQFVLPELAVQYGDYASWQQCKGSGDRHRGLVEYWKAQLTDLPSALELPADRATRALPSGRGSIHEFTLTGPQIPALRQLARNEATTLFSVMLTSFFVWLHRMTNTTDIVVGTPVANREHPEVQSLIGYFLNTLPIRTRIEAEQTSRQVLNSVTQTLLDAFSHADLAIEEIVEVAVKGRQFGTQPIFQVMFVLLEESTPSLKIGDTTGSPEFIHTETSKSDLTLFVNATGDEWICRLEYSTDLFDAATIESLSRSYQTLLSGIVAAPDQAIDRLPLLAPDERHKILVDWNQTQRDYPTDVCLHQLFEDQVRQTPDAIAVEFEERVLTYQELNRRANQLAHHLIQLGIRPADLIGVCLDRSLELIVALYGVLKAGGAYVPIDPEYPADRVTLMLENSGVQTVLTQDHLAGRLRDHSIQVICLDSPESYLSQSSDANPVSSVTSSHLAYMLYTSGSTGNPKGVLNSHRGVVNQLFWMQERFPLASTDVVLQKTPYSFDVSVWEFFWPLLSGAKLSVARPDGHKDAEYLVELIRSRGINVAAFVPSMLGFFLDAICGQECSSLRHVLCIGEALPAALRDRFYSKLDAQLHNLYGPTEAAVSVTHWACDRDQTTSFVPIGRPCANTQCYILDKHLEPLPVGIPGELYLGGVQVGQGYHRQPELTSAKFVPDPFDFESGSVFKSRLYRTGDLCRFLPDGNIQFLGRLDNMIKLRGYLIELEEIESMLLLHPNVRQVAVMGCRDHLGDQLLVGYITLKGEPLQHVTRELGTYLRAKLPEQMIPAAFMVLETLPQLTNGKIDRKKLPAPDLSNYERRETFLAPRTETEKRLAGLWKDVLGFETIGIHDNFFDLGGYSLRALRLIDQINRAGIGKLKLADLFTHPTIAEQAERLNLAAPESHPKTERRYLEPIRTEQSQPHLVIVGATVRVTIEDLPEGLSVWWLKLDGLHVDPHQDLDIPSQAAAHVKELIEAIPSGPILFCGFSYGGLLGVEIANQLNHRGHHQVELVLLEPPPVWHRPSSLRDYFRRYARALRAPERLKRVQRLLIRVIKKVARPVGPRRLSQAAPTANEDNWSYFEPYFKRHIRGYRLSRRLPHNVHLIGTSRYLESSLSGLKSLTSGQVEIHRVPEHFTHLDVARPQHNRFWIDVIREFVDKHRPSSTQDFHLPNQQVPKSS